MKLKSAALGILSSFICPVLWAQSPPADPLAENLFPPELVIQHQSDIRLSEEQRNALIGEVQKAQERFNDLQQRLQKEVEAMGALLKKEQVEEQAALAQFDKVLNQEREVKRAHLALVLGIRNKLTREQQAKLRDIKSKIAAGQLRSPEEVQRLLQAKIQKIQEGVERWQNDGRDPSAVAEIMQELEPLMKQGKHKDADALLDRALKLLNEPEKDKK